MPKEWKEIEIKRLPLADKIPDDGGAISQSITGSNSRSSLEESWENFDEVERKVSSGNSVFNFDEFDDSEIREKGVCEASFGEFDQNPDKLFKTDDSQEFDLLFDIVPTIYHQKATNAKQFTVLKKKKI